MHQLPQTAVNVRVPLTTRAAVLYLQCAVDKQRPGRLASGQ